MMAIMNSFRIRLEVNINPIYKNRMLAYFVRYMLMFGYAGEQAPRRIFGLQTFHVKPYEANAATEYLYSGMAEPIKVGHVVPQRSIANQTLSLLVDYDFGVGAVLAVFAYQYVGVVGGDSIASIAILLGQLVPQIDIVVVQKFDFLTIG